MSSLLLAKPSTLLLTKPSTTLENRLSTEQNYLSFFVKRFQIGGKPMPPKAHGKHVISCNWLTRVFYNLKAQRAIILSMAAQRAI